MNDSSKSSASSIPDAIACWITLRVWIVNKQIETKPNKFAIIEQREECKRNQQEKSYEITVITTDRKIVIKQAAQELWRCVQANKSKRFNVAGRVVVLSLQQWFQICKRKHANENK